VDNPEKLTTRSTQDT